MAQQHGDAQPHEHRRNRVAANHPHHSFLVTEYLSQIDDCDDAIDRVSMVIEPRLVAEQEAMALLETIPGVSPRTAEILLAGRGGAQVIMSVLAST